MAKSERIFPLQAQFIGDALSEVLGENGFDTGSGTWRRKLSTAVGDDVTVIRFEYPNNGTSRVTLMRHAPASAPGQGTNRTDWLSEQQWREQSELLLDLVVARATKLGAECNTALLMFRESALYQADPATMQRLFRASGGPREFQLAPDTIGFAYVDRTRKDPAVYGEARFVDCGDGTTAVQLSVRSYFKVPRRCGQLQESTVLKERESLAARFRTRLQGLHTVLPPQNRQSSPPLPDRALA